MFHTGLRKMLRSTARRGPHHPAREAALDRFGHYEADECAQ